MYEHVAVVHRTTADGEQQGLWDALLVQGWVEQSCVPVLGRPDQHSHLMRRSKDEPQEKPDTVEYEYLALEFPAIDQDYEWKSMRELCRSGRYDQLYHEGWRIELWARFFPERVGGVCVLRRPELPHCPIVDTTKPKDEPRMRRPQWSDPNIDWLAQNVFKRLSPSGSGLVCIGQEQIRDALKQALTMPGHEGEPSKDDEPRMWTEKELQGWRKLENERQ